MQIYYFFEGGTGNQESTHQRRLLQLSLCKIPPFFLTCSAIEKMVERSPSIVSTRGMDGMTPLHFSALNGDVETTRLILQTVSSLHYSLKLVFFPLWLYHGDPCPSLYHIANAFGMKCSPDVPRWDMYSLLQVVTLFSRSEEVLHNRLLSKRLSSMQRGLEEGKGGGMQIITLHRATNTYNLDKTWLHALHLLPRV